MVADEISATWFKKLPHLSVESRRIALMAKFVDCLVCDRKVKVTQTVAPVGVTEISLNELDAGA